MKPRQLLTITFYLTFFYVDLATAQTTFQGVVTDASNGTPIEMATVQLLRGENQRLVGYALTDTKGLYSIKSSGYTDSLHLVVSLLGYKSQRVSVSSGETVNFQLEMEQFSLREVEIRPGRVWGRQDTINYDISQFLSPKDESIKDIIKKLPGLEVDDLGKISYNGKDISNFYVEGMDLTDGRYNQITNNLQAKSVETLQVMENHQSIRILQDKVKVEDIAINLKLKPEFRNKWMVSLRGGLGYSSDELLWEGNLDALRLSRKSQSSYIYKGNNRGIDVTDEQRMMVDFSSSRLREPSTPSFLAQPSLTAPLKKEKLLFNDVHTLSGNRIYRLNEDTQLRINAGYTHDVQKQERGTETTYYQQEDTVFIADHSHTRIRSHEANLSINLENNSTERFLTNKFSASGNWATGTSNFNGNQQLRQQVNTTDMGLKNDFRNLWNKGKYTLEARSFSRFNHLPGELKINDVSQSLPLNHFYTDNSFSFLRKTGNLSQRYTAGVTGQVSNIKDGMSIYLTPNWQNTFSKVLVTLNTPIVWTHFPSADFSRMTMNPSLSIQYKYNYAWRYSLNASYKEQYGDITDFYSNPYLTDYRNTIQNNGKLSMIRLQSYSGYAEYKNTIQEFFASLSLSHSRTWSNRTYEQLFEEEMAILAARDQSNEGTGWTLRGTLSKGFFDWGMKASLNYMFGLQKGERISNGQEMKYKSSYMQYEPKISWSPSRRFDASYHSTIRYGGSTLGESTHLTPLWNVVQKVQVSYDFFPIEINLSADHYLNDVNNTKTINAFFTDASLRWKTGSWQIDFIASNLFNKKQYSYTEYSSLESYTSWVNIRGREFLVSARYKF